MTKKQVTIIGKLNSKMIGNHINGWLASDDNNDRRYAVIVLNNSTKFESIADKKRDDLLKKISNGNCGFNIEIPEIILAKLPKTIDVSLFDKTSDHIIDAIQYENPFSNVKFESHKENNDIIDVLYNNFIPTKDNLCELFQDYELCEKSIFFDLEWYKEKYHIKTDPVLHYLLKGFKLGYNPSKFFDGNEYLNNYPSVKNNLICPLVHFEKEGKKNQFLDYFNADEYYFIHHDVAKAKASPYAHFIKNGIKENRPRKICVHKANVEGYSSKYLGKVLLIGHEISLTGAPISLYLIAKSLLNAGYFVDMWVFNTRKEISNLYNDLNLNVYYVPREASNFSDVKSYLHNYNFIFLNTAVTYSYAKVCYLNELPHCWMIREDINMLSDYAEKFKCKELMFNDSSNIVCVSEYSRDQCHSILDISKVGILHNCVDDIYGKLPIKKEGKERVFTICGLLSKRKGIDICISAFLRISIKYNWKLNIIGKISGNSDELFNTLMELVQNYKNITWYEEIFGDEKWNLFNSTDVFLVPSLSESCSRIVLEAAMLAKPVIISENVGAKYLVKNPNFIVKTGNINSLQNAIEYSINLSYQELEKIGKDLRDEYLRTSTLDVFSKNVLEIVEAKAVPNTDTIAYSNYDIASLFSKRKYFIDDENLYFDKISISNLLVNKDSINVSSNNQDPIFVIVPVYNGLFHVKKLLPSLIKNTIGNYKVIIINDCSPDTQVESYILETIKGLENYIYKKNDVNLGFVRTVNKASQFTGNSNFVLLNSDTEVPYNWLNVLCEPLFTTDKVASVTPMSNGASIFSFPFSNNDELNTKFLSKIGIDVINNSIKDIQIRNPIELPTAHGFCMAISKKVWNEIGPLNELLYGKGYGEENDWSRRAVVKGYKNILAPNLYVSHYHGGSFSENESKKGKQKSSVILKNLYPDYKLELLTWIKNYPMDGNIFLSLLKLSKSMDNFISHYNELSSYINGIHETSGIHILKYDTNDTDNVEITIKIGGFIIQVREISQDILNYL